MPAEAVAEQADEKGEETAQSTPLNFESLESVAELLCDHCLHNECEGDPPCEIYMWLLGEL